MTTPLYRVAYTAIKVTDTITAYYSIPVFPDFV